MICEVSPGSLLQDGEVLFVCITIFIVIPVLFMDSHTTLDVTLHLLYCDLVPGPAPLLVDVCVVTPDP